MNVSAGVLPAAPAITLQIDGIFAQFMHRAAELEFALGRESHSPLRQLRWNNTVKHIYATVHALKYIQRRADAHEITGKVFGKVFSYEFRKVVALTMGFADGET